MNPTTTAPAQLQTDVIRRFRPGEPAEADVVIRIHSSAEWSRLLNDLDWLFRRPQDMPSRLRLCVQDVHGASVEFEFDPAGGER